MTGKPCKHFVSDFFGTILQYFFPFVITCVGDLRCAAVRIIYIYIPNRFENIICQVKCLPPAVSCHQCIRFVFQIILHRTGKIPRIPVINKTAPVAILPYNLIDSLLQSVHLFFIYPNHVSGHKRISDLIILPGQLLYKRTQFRFRNISNNVFHLFFRLIRTRFFCQSPRFFLFLNLIKHSRHMFTVVSVFRIGTGTVHFIDLTVFHFNIYFVVLCALHNGMIPVFCFLELLNCAIIVIHFPAGENMLSK